ncbi:ATP-binding protein [Clostridium botulinum]|nr:ATP-binding protein [Clostridium botulinum]NFF24636.1 ATP-binding protein [Clostridium botulinum]NFI50331.1 ATP-binding protein [Clostridium botulinum]NFI71510.1 ATP-binding protein [Clostridium botulinum]NFI88517.1 ATP-binding protein [Clostridium botulinum]
MKYNRQLNGGSLMKYTAGLTNKSINKLGISQDFNECISEYIWNGFDAGANKIEITFNENELGGIESIYIKDNGKGIIYEDLDKTFKCVLDSNKSIIKRQSNIHGSKGKGRFSFISFAEIALWNTVYNDSNNNQKYSIQILKSNATEFDVSDKCICSDEIGTTVILSGVNSLTKENISNYNFIQYLKDQFAWFLYLNRENKYEILIDGKSLDYMTFIDESLSKELTLSIDNYDFKVNFIKWNGKIKEKYYFYFRNSENTQVYKKFTSFNKKSLAFPHSMYVKSNYFDDFYEDDSTTDKLENQIGLLNEKTQKDKTFKELNNKLIYILKDQIKLYIKDKAPEKIEQLEKEGVFPKFKTGKYGEMKKEDLKEVLTEIYVIQPKIFNGPFEHKKTIVGFLNLLLDTDEREGIINIMDSINSLTTEERNQLNDVLRKTTLSRIIKTVSLIQNRLKVIEALKFLVHDMTNFTNERDHIQKIIEENYWLFGEQYNIVSADKNFEKALENYTYILDGYKSEEKYLIDNPQRLRRPDIFMCRSRSIYSENATEDEENIIVELKAPSVVLDSIIYRQIEDYMRLISKEGRFNSSRRKWKFIMVSQRVDEDIMDLYDTFKDKGKRFLVRGGKQFEIYAMTWDDVFKNFELNHKYILNKLEFNKTIINKEIEDMSDEEGRLLVNEITNEILNLKEQLQ